MANSINTNVAASIALHALNASSSDIQKTENEISTGLRVGSATDDGATWSIAQNMRGLVSGWQSVSQSLSRGQSIVDVAVGGSQTISDLLNQIKAKALAFSDLSNDTTSEDAYKADIQSLVKEIDIIANNSDFNGVNLINTGVMSLNPPPMYPAPAGDQHVDWVFPAAINQDGTYTFKFASPAGSWFGFDVQPSGIQITSSQQPGMTLTAQVAAGQTGAGAWCPLTSQLLSATFTPSNTPPLSVVTDPSGNTTTLQQFNLTAYGLSLDSLDWSNPTTILSTVSNAISTVNSVAAQFGTQSQMLGTSADFANKVQDTLTAGVGNLVDADIAKDSASLQAQQVKEKLATQAVSIANQTPSFLLSLFK